MKLAQKGMVAKIKKTFPSGSRKIGRQAGKKQDG
jgi:hypothetical protein